MYIDPGELNKKIEIIRQYTGEDYDDEGHRVKVTMHIRSCWARVSATSGTELIKSGTELSDKKKRFLVRASSIEIKTGMTVVYRGKNYDITYVNTYHDDGDWTEIWAELREQEGTGHESDD
jgi:SPP1 family predicted phage head-tail adaptor